MLILIVDLFENKRFLREKIAQFSGQVGDSRRRGVIRIAQFRE